MDNISIYSINKRLHIWKAGQSERLSGLLFCRFFLVYVFICQARAPPFPFWNRKTRFRKENRMAEEKKYYISIDRKKFEVCRELYEAYTKGQRKDRYFTCDLKHEHERVDTKTGEVKIIPAREDSYERLLEAEKQFMTEAESVEDAAIRAVMLEKLNSALHMLTESEAGIIYSLFYEEISETRLARDMGIARTTLQSQKYRILDKLKEML